LLREERAKSGKIDSFSSDNKKLKVTQTFAVLVINGYELNPDGFDEWNDRCVQFFNGIFGKDSHEAKVLRQESEDSSVNIRVRGQKARAALLKVGKHIHPN